MFYLCRLSVLFYLFHLITTAPILSTPMDRDLSVVGVWLDTQDGLSAVSPLTTINAITIIDSEDEIDQREAQQPGKRERVNSTKFIN